MELFLILLGLLILAINFLDFFHTILSGRGFGRITGKLNKLLGKLTLKTRNKFLFEYSGFIHLMFTTLIWLLLLIGGCFIIYTSGETMVVQSQTKDPASLLERFYFTGYVLSTLGIGDFVPGNDVSRVLTSLLPFSGFILITTVLTYFLSVVGAVQQKKQLAYYIATLGKDIDELYNSAIADDNYNSLLENASSLREKIIQNSSSYVFFPITQYYLTSKQDASLELQLIRMHEALVILSYQFEEKSAESLQIQSILASIGKYLKLGLEEAKNFALDPEELSSCREFWRQHGLDFKADPEKDNSLNATLKSAGWGWKEVYQLES